MCINNTHVIKVVQKMHNIKYDMKMVNMKKAEINYKTTRMMTSCNSAASVQTNQKF